MSGRLVLAFERGGKLAADLLPDVAPTTVQAVLEMLPMRSVVHHTRWCGREIYMPVTARRPVPRENQTSQTNTGDLIFWREWDADQSAGAGAIAVYYGPEVTRDHRGYLQVNIFGRVSQSQWAIIEQVGLRVWRDGTEQVEIRLAQAWDDDAQS